MGVRLLSGLGTVFRMRIWDTLLERWPGGAPTVASYRPPCRATERKKVNKVTEPENILYFNNGKEDTWERYN
jgi:hypothetical protein